MVVLFSAKCMYWLAKEMQSFLNSFSGERFWNKMFRIQCEMNAKTFPTIIVLLITTVGDIVIVWNQYRVW